MYQFYTKDCPKGWAYVRDYMGNLVYYGTEDECKLFIEAMKESIKADIIKSWEVLVDEG